MKMLLQVKIQKFLRRKHDMVLGAFIAAPFTQSTALILPQWEIPIGRWVEHRILKRRLWVRILLDSFEGFLLGCKISPCRFHLNFFAFPPFSSSWSSVSSHSKTLSLSYKVVVKTKSSTFCHLLYFPFRLNSTAWDVCAG